jgi:alginate O-acetyltransferase complex protein AlgI
LLIARIHHFNIRPEGWIHWFPTGPGSFDVPRGPLGVMCYLALVPLFWIVPRRWRATYLIVSSLLLALATVGPAFAITIAATAVASYIVIRTCANPRRYWLGVGLAVAAYVCLLARPQPPWLPPLAGSVTVYFYLHWAGLAYLFLRTLHVLNDVTRHKIAPPRPGDFLAYLLFAPSLRMGPIQRYSEFHEQMRGDLAEHRRLGYATVRMGTGILRLFVLSILVVRFPAQALFDDPWQFSVGRYALGLYLAPMYFYLWMSGYVDLSIGVARAMGFVVPENFNYPWTSINIAEFWQRWHITLGSWLRDYIFTPLVRRRWHYFWAFVITFTLCGAWHGGWCWTLSGAAQGVGLGVMRFWSQTWKRQKARQTSLYRALARVGLVGTAFNSFLAWLVTFHYEVACFLIIMDLNHSGALVGRRFLELLTRIPMH